MADGDEERSLLAEDLWPPMPTPDHARRCRESIRGTITVVCICAFSGGVAQWLASGGGAPALSEEVASWLATALWSEIIVAAVCLAGLRWSDPGVLRRDPWQQLPDDIAAKLLGCKPLPDENVRVGGRTFCVRCLLWRPALPSAAGLASSAAGGHEQGPKVHHCSICQRCVSNFSHHCGFFGRCIAGRGLRGNRKYLQAIVADGHAAALTHALILLALARDHYGHGTAGGLAALLLYMVRCGVGGGQMLLTLGRFWILRRCGPARLYHLFCCDEEPPTLPPEPMVVAVLGPGCCGLGNCHLPIKC